MGEPELQANLDRCMALIPDEDDGPWIPEQAAGEDAGAAVAYALRCRQNGRGQEAAWSARRAYEALDHYVINHEDIDVNLPGAEEEVLAHPVVQSELARQLRDLEDLSLMGPDAALRLRDRAAAEAASFFGPAETTDQR